MIKYKKWTLRRAYNTVSKIRGVARPNNSFLKQLIQYERQYLGLSSTTIVKDTQLVDGELISRGVPHWLKNDLPERYKDEFKPGRGMNRVLENAPDANHPTT